MKIIIVGAGISGLSTYLFLKKHLPNPSPPATPHEIQIYETYDSDKKLERQLHSQDDFEQTTNTIAVGGGLGLGPNGLNVIKRLNEKLLTDIAQTGHCITTWKMSNSRGWNLQSVGIQSEDTPPMNSVMIARQGLWHCIRQYVPDEVIEKKKISKVSAEDGKSPVVSFADESPDIECDLVLGCDGLRSVVRSGIFGEEMYPPRYEGLVGVGGFIPSSYLRDNGVKDGEMGIVFGANGFFGYGYNTTTTSPSASQQSSSLTSQTNPPGPEATWWSTYYLPHLPATRALDPIAAKTQLLARHGHWKNPVIQKIIATASIDAMYPTWTTPDLPTWERSGLVLLGDAAHALHPSSGQGANQALEDAESFARLLGARLRTAYRSPDADRARTEREARDAAAREYTALRMPRVKKIQARAAMLGDFKKEKNILQEMVMYLFIWGMGFFSADKFTREVNNYDVPAEVERVLAGSERTG